MEVLKLLQDMKVKLHGFTARDTEDKICIIDIKLEISSVDELQRIIKSLKKVDSVYDVRRAK
jgi:GTP pyrophosphokinase